MNTNEKLAELLFPDVKKTPEYYEELYPERNLKEGARVTRFAPSPTGFLHIGGLFAAMVAKLTADKSGGEFYLRIEDTDKKREIENGVTCIVEGLSNFGIDIKEGRLGETDESEKGNYGPYLQSERGEIYHCFAKELVKKGLAYPCFCSEEEIAKLREEQEKAGDNPGVYGKYAVCRNIPFDKVEERIKNGDPYVLRFRSPGDPDKRIKIQDLIKGKIEIPENNMDVVLLKTDGIPTYHFAHCVDDHLMRSTHIVRGDEWISSLPIHVQLFRACDFKVPKYAHIAPIMKLDDGNKRKLSKRKDPEAAVSYYVEQGYPKESVLEYLLTLANSNFEDWRRCNKAAPLEDFDFNIKKMSTSGALFDLAKLSDVSKNVISFMTADKVLDDALVWSENYAPEFYALINGDREKAHAILSIGRGGKKPRKDIAKWSDLPDYMSYFYETLFKPDYTLPERVSTDDAVQLLESYKDIYDVNDDNSEWFNKVKSICEPNGYTTDMKAFKKDPGDWKGTVADVSTVIRIAVTGRTNTPDLCNIMSILGKEICEDRIQRAIDYYKEN